MQITTPPLVETPPDFADVEAAAARLRGVAHRTPVLTSSTVDRRVNAAVFFKCENFQRAGAFKFRGAYNALAQLSDEQKRRGVLAYSSGNHAQAVALAGKLLGAPAVIVMPHDAPAVKLAATRGYGAEVIVYDPIETAREELGRRVADERGLAVIPPFDHRDVIAGQGTVARELFDEVGELDLLLVCCGGGGLLGGSAIVARKMSPACRVIGVEPEAGDDATRSFRSKKLQTVRLPQTIADGARTPALGRITFPLMLAQVDDMATVSDQMLVRTMAYLWERMKMIVEPTGALAAAALLEGVVAAEGKRVGVIISGGNVDLRQACAWFNGVMKDEG